MHVKYYNKMPFPVKFRKIWVDGNPAVELQSGEPIDGPDDILSQYSFLARIPVDFHLVNTTIQDSLNIYKDELLKDTNASNFHIITESKKEEIDDTVIVSEPIVENKEESDVETEQNIDNFDIKNVNWLSIKVDFMEKLAIKHNINIDHTKALKPKDRRWELVKLLKNKFAS